MKDFFKKILSTFLLLSFTCSIFPISSASPIGFWCKDKIGKSDYFLEITSSKMILRNNDESICSTWNWDVTGLNNKHLLRYNNRDFKKSLKSEEAIFLSNCSSFNFKRIDEDHLVINLQKYGNIKFVSKERKEKWADTAKGVGKAAGVVAGIAAGALLFWAGSSDSGSSYDGYSGDLSSTSSYSKQAIADNKARSFNSEKHPYENAISKGYLCYKTLNGGTSFAGTKYVYEGNSSKYVTRIFLTGSRYQDFAQANSIVGLNDTPFGYTWHHVDDYDVASNTSSIELITKEAHNASKPHAGSCAQYEAVKGVSYN